MRPHRARSRGAGRRVRGCELRQFFRPSLERRGRAQLQLSFDQEERVDVTVLRVKRLDQVRWTEPLFDDAHVG